jgi:hypothetical protein
MSNGDQALRQLPRNRLIVAVLGTAAGAALVVLAFVLPAEFNRDPLGTGRLVGLSRLYAPDAQVADTSSSGPAAREYREALRSDTIEVPLGYVGGGLGPYALEYKVRMKKGATLIYEWKAFDLPKPNLLSYDFHGHTTPPGGNEKDMIVADYRKATGGSGRGALVAPFDGIHGWYFENSADVPVTVRVKLTGFYDLVPAGQVGNEEGIIANVPADPAHPLTDEAAPE